MTDHNILGTAGNGGLAEPSVALLETRRFHDLAHVWSVRPDRVRRIERRVWLAVTAGAGQLGGAVNALE